MTGKPIAADTAVQKAIFALRKALSEAGEAQHHGSLKAFWLVGQFQDGLMSHLAEGCTCPMCAMNAISGIIDLAADDDKGGQAVLAMATARTH